MTLLSPEVYVLKTDHTTREGVSSFVTLKFDYGDGGIGYVHLPAEVAQSTGMQLLLVAAEVEPELVW